MLTGCSRWTCRHHSTLDNTLRVDRFVLACYGLTECTGLYNQPHPNLSKLTPVVWLV